MARSTRAARKPRRPYHHGKLRRALLDEALRTRDANPSHYRVMFGGFVDPEEDRDPELAAEAGGAFQALVDALAALQHDVVVRGDDTLLMARFVWSVVHGVAMLSIDGQLREPGSIEELMRYALERLGTGIAAGADHRPA
jgi:hypothetical protein